MLTTLRIRIARLDADARLFAGLYLCLLPLFVAPLFMTAFLPGLDLPFHLAMADMLSKAGDPSSPYAPWYEPRLGIAPYAAHYGALIVLGHVMTLVHAHLVVTIAYVASFPLALAALLDAMGRSRLPALLGFLLAYNLTLHYGFVSFAFSLPVLFAMLAAFARLMTAASSAGRRGWPWGGPAGAAAALAVLLFLCHLQNYLYGVCAALAFIVFVRAPLVRRGQAMLALAPSLACLAWWQMRTRFEGDPLERKKTLAFAWEQVRGNRLADAGRRTLLEDAWDRVQHIDVHVLRGFTDNVHVKGCDALLTVLGGCVLLGLLGLGLPRPLDAPRSRLGIAAAVAFLGALVAYAALPHHLPAFELMTFYPRFAVLVVAVGVLVIPAGLRRFRRWEALVVATPIAYVSLLYGIELVRHYRLFGEEISDFAAVVDAVPPGGRSIGIVFNRRSHVLGVESPFVGLASYYVSRHPAPTSFTPLSYCGMRHMPCRLRTGAPPLPDVGPWEMHRFHAPTEVPFYDYFLLRAASYNPMAPFPVEAIKAVGSWAAYRKTAPPPAPPPAALPDAGAD